MTLEPHPLPGSRHASSLYHGGDSTEGDGMLYSSSSDQEGTTTTTGSNTSSRDSSETPPEEQGSSTLSTSRETESHSDSSALDLEEEGTTCTSGLVLRRRRHHHHNHRGDNRHQHKLETSSDSSVLLCSSTDATGAATDTVSVSSSSDGRTEAVGEEDRRIGVALSTPNGQTEGFGAQLRRTSGHGRVDLQGYNSGPAGLASLEHQGVGVGAGVRGGGLGTFSSLQQRKEEMLKKARE